MPISKFYLRDVASPNSGTLPGAGDVFVDNGGLTGDAAGARISRDAYVIPGAANPDVESSITSNADLNQQNWSHRRFVSRPLAAQTFASTDGNWTFSYARTESNLLHNQQIALSIYAWRPSTGVRLGDFSNEVNMQGTEPTVAAAQQAESLSATWRSDGTQAIIDGDILVFEVSAAFTQGMATAYTNQFAYDGTTEASTTTCATFIAPPVPLVTLDEKAAFIRDRPPPFLRPGARLRRPRAFFDHIDEAVETIQFDAASSSGYEASLSSYNWNHTCTGTHRGLIVAISIFATGTVTGITYAGTNMVFESSNSNGVYRTEIWRLENPASGTNQVAVTLSTSLTSIGSAASYTGVNQTDMVAAVNGANGIGGTPSASVTTVDDKSWVLSALATADATTSATNGAERANNAGALGSGAISDTGGVVSPPAAQSMGWAAVGITDSWALGVIVLEPFAAHDYAVAWSVTQPQSYGVTKADASSRLWTQGKGPILDSFDRADENPLSGGGTWTTGVLVGNSALKVVSQHVEASNVAANAENSSYWNVQNVGPDCEVGYTILAKRGDAGDYYMRLFLRIINPHTASVDGYQALFGREGGVEEFAVFRILNAVNTQLVKTSRAFSADDNVLFGVIGTQLYLTHNGTQVWTASDSTWTGAGVVGLGIGIYNNPTTSSPQLDAFRGGIIPKVVFLNASTLTRSSTQTQTASLTKAASVTKNWAQAVTLGLARAVTASRLWTQIQTFSFAARTLTLLRSWTQAESLSPTKDVAASRSVGQAQSLSTRSAVASARSFAVAQNASFARTVGKAASLAQSCSGALQKAVSVAGTWSQPRVFTQLKAVATTATYTTTTLASFLLQEGHALTLAFVEGTTASFARAVNASRSWTETAAVTLTRSITAGRSWTQAQSFSTQKAVASARSWTEAQVFTRVKAVATTATYVATTVASFSFNEAHMLVLAFTEATSAAFSRAVASTRSWTQGQALSLSKAMTAAKAFVATQSASFTRAVGKQFAATQAQAATFRREAGKLLTNTQAQVLSQVKAVGRTLNYIVTEVVEFNLPGRFEVDLSWVQGTTTTLHRAVSTARVWTQAQAATLRKAISTSRVWTQTQALVLLAQRQFLAAITVAQVASVVVSRAVGKANSYGQTQVVSATNAVGHACSVGQAQVFTLARAVAKTLGLFAQSQAGTLQNAVTLAQTLIQGSSSVFNRGGSKALLWTQAAIPALRRDVGISKEWVQAQFFGGFGRPFFVALDFTQDALLTVGRRVGKLLTWTQAQIGTVAIPPKRLARVFGRVFSRSRVHGDTFVEAQADSETGSTIHVDGHDREGG